MCEYILSAEFKSILGPELTWAYDYPSASASQILCNIYFAKAASAHKAAQDTERWIEKLRDLATSKEAGSDDVVYKLNDASLLLGIFLRRYGGADESVWKACFRRQIHEGIDMLSDDDGMNDVYAYSLLSKVLMAAGDKKSAIEASAVVLNPVEAFSDPDLLKAFEAIGFEVDYIACDGPCNTQFYAYNDPPHKELYFCEDCINTTFLQRLFPYCEEGGVAV